MTLLAKRKVQEQKRSLRRSAKESSKADKVVAPTESSDASATNKAALAGPGPISTHKFKPRPMIPNLASLKRSSAGALFVIIETEPWNLDVSKPAGIGISLLRSPNARKKQLDSLPQSLSSIHELSQLENHWIQINGRMNQGKRHQLRRFGKRHAVDNDQLEVKLLSIIEQFIGAHYSSSGGFPVILACFDMNHEHDVLSKSCPRFLNRPTTSLDLQTLAKEVTSEGSSWAATSYISDTLAACGYLIGENISQSASLKYKAACNTVQAAVFVIQILSLDRNHVKPAMKASKAQYVHWT